MRETAFGTRRLLEMAWRIDRGRLMKAGALVLVGALSTPFIALLVRGFANAVLAGDTRTAPLLGILIAVLLVFELLMSHFAHLFHFELGELIEKTLYDEMIVITNGGETIDHFDSPSFSEKIGLVREDLMGTRQALESALLLGGLAPQFLLTTVILGTIDLRLLFLPLAAIPPVILSNMAHRMNERGKERTAGTAQLSRHLFEVATSANTIKEIRISGAESVIMRKQFDALETTNKTRWRLFVHGAYLRALGQMIFALTFGAAVFVVVQAALAGHRSIGDVLLVVTLAVQVSMQVASALAQITKLEGAGRTFERLADLRSQIYASAAARHPVLAEGTPGHSPVLRRLPSKMGDGIRLEGVGFSYPGDDRPILRDIDLHIPAGSSLALVGENGAGKSTLVKLLCGLYKPTSGRITVDGVDISSTGTVGEWRSRIAMLFQDFARMELRLRENVGIGDIDHLEDKEALDAALTAANAQRIVAGLSDGVETLLDTALVTGQTSPVVSGRRWGSRGRRCELPLSFLRLTSLLRR